MVDWCLSSGVRACVCVCVCVCVYMCLCAPAVSECAAVDGLEGTGRVVDLHVGAPPQLTTAKKKQSKQSGMFHTHSIIHTTTTCLSPGGMG